MWVFTFPFARERLREEKNKGREGGKGDINPAEAQSIILQRDGHVIFPVMLIGHDLHSQHCQYALVYTIHTHALTCSPHTHTHTLHTCCSCKWYVLSPLMCVHFLCCLLLKKDAGGLGANFCSGRRRVSQGGRNTIALVRQIQCRSYALMWRLQ